MLLAGASGAIGSVVVPALARRGHEVVGVDLPGRGAELETDCSDPVAVEAMMDEVRPAAVVHLAGIPTESDLSSALSSHVQSTAALTEAMLRHGGRRFVYASSNHAVGRTPRGQGLLGVDAPPRPDTFYGVAKVAAESLLQLYSDRHGLDVICCRIGSFLPEPTSRRQLATWLSPADAVRMFDAALTAPSPGFRVLYGISANTRAWWDLGPGRNLGYHPEDDAESWAEQLEAEAETEDDRAQNAVVGGPFATGDFDRAAFDAPGPG